MKFYIRHRDSGLYFKQVDHWVSKGQDSKAFDSREKAEAFAKKLLLVHVQVLSHAEALSLEKSRDSLEMMRFGSKRPPV